MELGKVADGSRTLRFGDTVKEGQLLAVVWSRELGEKKSGTRRCAVAIRFR